MIKTSTTLAFLLTSTISFSQYYDKDYDKNLPEKISRANLGIGFGLDYGGIGLRLTGLPSKNFGLFGAVGFALAGVGYNVGLNANFNSKGKAQGYITAMYGYNAAILVTGAIEFKKLYYGPSFGGGIRLNRNNGFWNFELLVPIRDPAFQDKNNSLKNQGVQTSYVPPFTISVGYHFCF